MGKIGLPAKVPAASLSSEDESIGGEGSREPFSTTTVRNYSVSTMGGKGRIFLIVKKFNYSLTLHFLLYS